MTMLRKILLLALLVFAPCTSFAEDLTCEPNSNGDLTMKQYTDCLLQKYTGEAIVTDGTVIGTDSSGKVPYADEYRSIMSANSLVALLTPICTQYTSIYAQPAGAYNYVWCRTPTVSLQATRETWFTQYGAAPKLIILRPYNCSNPQQYAAMPSIVKTVVCP
jgi:hypothetical protein